MIKEHRFGIAVPSGLKIHTSEFNVAGFNHYLDDFLKIMKSDSTVSFTFAREPSNKHDKNAVAIFGKRPRMLFGDLILKIGYMPRDLAKDLVEGDMLEKVMLRPKYYKIDGTSGYFKVDLLEEK